jgi:D-alanyl-D-alanine carboxypeptidase/D-alanyl-D-alanine-endopeptidase (penicillin-binding protein 4)
MKRFTFFYLLLIFLGMSVMPVDAALAPAISSILSAQPNDMQIGVYIKDLDSEQVLYDANGARPMTPASNTKVFTAAAAYLYLGPDYHYVTQVATAVPVTKVMLGNIYIDFSGDPTLTSADIYALIAALKQQGVLQVRGNVVIDDSVFSGPAYGLGWAPGNLAYCYAAPVNGAIINNNCMALHIVKARRQQVPFIKQYTTRFPVVNELKLAHTNLHSCSFQPLITAKNNIVLQGCLPPRGHWNINFAIKDSNEYARQVLASAFAHAGIRVRGKFITGTTPAAAKPIVAHNSNNLQTILSYMLKHSDNVYAGAVGKTLGNVYYSIGSYKSGVNAINAILTAHLGVDFKPVYLEDSSGMSAYNLIAPQQLVQVLDYMYHQSIANVFMNSLAIGGQQGTLASRLNQWPLLGHVFAKTGTIDGVSTLSGYVAIPGHSVVAFAIMMNGYQGGPAHARYLQDQIVQAIAENT